jgi:hypothetical protein
MISIAGTSVARFSSNEIRRREPIALLGQC